MSRRSRSNSNSAGSVGTLNIDTENKKLLSSTSGGNMNGKSMNNGESKVGGLHGLNNLHGMHGKNKSLHASSDSLANSIKKTDNKNSLNNKTAKPVDGQVKSETLENPRAASSSIVKPISTVPKSRKQTSIETSSESANTKNDTATNNIPSNRSKQNGNAQDSSKLETLIKPRNRLVHILVLKSLNKTFETKYLVVPFKPEVLKLGRPVSNTNNNNSSSNTSSSNSNGNNNNNSNNVGGSNDKSNKSEAQPDNGHFDSRILSRNHASISCDPATSNIYLKDLHSSNGTYLNGEKLKPEVEVEIKIGDVITLGADISSNGEHKKISALVEDINILPLVADDYNTSTLSNNNSALKNTSNITSTSVTQRAAFEAAMFGDVNNDLVSDDMWGQENELLSGLFFNNTIGTSASFINVIKVLNEEIMLERAEQIKLQSMEQFLLNYTTNLEYLNKLRIDKNDSTLAQFQTTLKNKLTSKYDTLLAEEFEKYKVLQQENELLKDQVEHVETREIQNLKFKIDDLTTLLQVEKYKHDQLANKEKELEFAEKNGTSNSNENDVESTNETLWEEHTNNNNNNGGPTEFSKGERNSTEAQRLGEAPLIVNKSTKKKKDRHLHTVAYLASISVVGVFTAFIAYSQNK